MEDTVTREEEAVAVRWEKFMPRMAMRILLVESDESTRQIIAALLEKCGYKVAAVGDGLKAWELLKRKPQNIDLVLTEFDLPSISGYALLTLIMEHGICKNTPVIMMSSQDSVSTVYKCMLKGAADFLVKPVRMNELRNLWQHVWRRQASRRNGLQAESLAQQKEGAADENNGLSTPSSGYMACVQRNVECIEKGNDSQSSCTKPDKDVEIVHAEFPPEIDTNMWKTEECIESTRRKHDNKNSGLVVAHGEATIREDDVAINFIGAFDNYNCEFIFSDVTNNNKVDSSLMLDLSLRRFHPSGSVNQISEDRKELNHSDASAFSRYINKVPQPLHSPASICNQQRDFGTNSEKHFSDQTFDYNSDTHNSPLRSQKQLLSSATTHSQQAGVTFSSRQQKVISLPVPRSFQQVYKSTDQNFDSFAKQADNNQNRKLDSSDSATDQRTSSSFSNSTAGNHNSIACRNKVCVDQTALGGSVVENGNNNGIPVFDTKYQRNVQREAALNKFRLKRKERCFEKKVRYESRKKLAEKRPRVKGQFVRQTAASVETDILCGNTVGV